jgi:ubiquitin-like domain-containing CTD phosphatase 1
MEDNEENDMDDLPLHEMEVHLKKLEQRVKSADIEELSPHVHKRLLVLDIDYTLFDHRTPCEEIGPLTRPFLHEFLTAANKNYDIVIWSATSYKWVFLKCKEMGLLESDQFKIRFILSEKPMFTVEADGKEGKSRVVRVKPLPFIWKLYPEQYSSKNTIMFDDVRHNFLFNKKNGLRIKAFRNGPSSRDDTELLRLKEFLDIIKDVDDITTLDLKNWSNYLK